MHHQSGKRKFGILWKAGISLRKEVVEWEDQEQVSHEEAQNDQITQMF